MSDHARGRTEEYGEAAGMLADAAGRPLASWEALKAAVTNTGTESENALYGAVDAADGLTSGFDEAGRSAGGAGAAAKKTAEEALAGWAQVTKIRAVQEHRSSMLDHQKCIYLHHTVLQDRCETPIFS